MSYVGKNKDLGWPRNFLCDLLDSREGMSIQLASDFDEIVDRLAGEMSERQQRFIKLRYKDFLTLKSIGEVFGIRPEGARQIGAKTLRQFRLPRRLKEIKQEERQEIMTKHIFTVPQMMEMVGKTVYWLWCDNEGDISAIVQEDVQFANIESFYIGKEGIGISVGAHDGELGYYTGEGCLADRCRRIYLNKENAVKALKEIKYD